MSYDYGNRVNALLDMRGASQRGRAKPRISSSNPLSGRAYDMACGGPLYREPYKKSFRYKCSVYQQTKGKHCEHNHIAGPLATEFALSVIRQHLLSPKLLPKLQEKLQALADAEKAHSKEKDRHHQLKSKLATLDSEILLVKKNLARAADDDIFEAISREFQELHLLRNQLSDQLAELNDKAASRKEEQVDVDRLIEGLRKLSGLAREAGDMAAAGEIFRLVNLKLFLSFHKVKWKNRSVSRVNYGLVTFGSEPTPIPLYVGPTGRDKINEEFAKSNSGSGGGTPEDDVPNKKVKSLGNVSRADRI